MSQKRKRSPEPKQEPGDQTIFRSTSIEDRSSKFIGYYSPSLKPKELQGLQEIASASHKMVASRRESNQQSITGGTKYVTDHDSDDEKYGGRKIAKVLEAMEVKGSCAVGRWFGGTLLGPVRFEHIETCAKEAIQNWKDSVVEQASKKRKAEEDAAEKAKLVKILADRDGSIEVLRKLAMEKEDNVKRAKSTEAASQPSQDGSQADGDAIKPPQGAPTTPKPAMDYSVMTLERLKALEKARDATLSFLLKRIDKAETELARPTVQDTLPVP